MATDDATRRQLYDLLDRDTSAETAALLMDHIPPTGWPEFATKADIAATRADLASEIAATRTEIATTRTELGTEIAAVKADLASTKENLDVRFERLELKIDSSRDQTLSAVRGEIASNTQHFIYGSIGIVIATAGVVLTAAHLG